MMRLNERRVRFGPFEVDLGTRELWRHGIRIKLGGQPFQILIALLENPGELVSRDELRKRIWADDTFVDFSHGLNAAVNKLREALCDSPEEPRYIETLPRRGYRFIAKVEEVLETSEVQEPVRAAPSTRPMPPAPVASPRSVALADEGWQVSVPVKRQTLLYLGAALAALALFVLAIAHVAEWNLADSAHIAERAMKLAAERRSPSHSPAIWRVDVAHAMEPDARTRVVSLGQEAIGGPQPSPDGKKLAFQSGATEGSDIWVSNLDGSSPVRLTNIGACGVPRWSPDNRWIAFDTDGRSGHAGIFVVDPESGVIREVVKDRWNNSVPSWSWDGKWIYFASNRATDGEENQVWKIFMDNSHRLVQVTRKGGFSAYESQDGHTLYYAKHRYENPEIWQVPVTGGEEKRVSALLLPSTWANWALTANGILFLSEYTEKSSTLEYFDFATQGVRPLGPLENASFWLASSLDGKSVWYSELTEEQAHHVFKAGMD